MKNNKTLIIIAVVLLNVLVVFMIGQTLLGKTSEFDQTINEARQYAKQELCGKAIDKYNEALVIKDDFEVQLEMLKVYEKGLDIGEFSDSYSIVEFVNTMVNTYREEPKAYEAACELFIKYNKFEDCAKLLMTARDLNVTSEKIEEYRQQVRYKYTKIFSMYTGVLPEFDGMYSIETNGEYTYLNDEASPDVDGIFSYATSFSEGYAFVKVDQLDGTEKSFVINKEGQRQVYLNDVEISTGVGKAKDKNNKDILLLAGKVGDKYKYFDMTGKSVLGEYKFAGRFRNNVAAVEESEGKWKLINGEGKPIVDKVFSDVILNEFDECAPKGLIFAKEGEKYHIYDLEGKQVGKFACDDAKAFVDDYAAFKNGEMWGFVDAKGEIVIEPQYEDAKSFSNLMGAVKLGGRWSFINPKNEVVIEETFEDVGYLSNKGICFAKDDGYWSSLKMYYTGK